MWIWVEIREPGKFSSLGLSFFEETWHIQQKLVKNSTPPPEWAMQLYIAPCTEAIFLWNGLIPKKQRKPSVQRGLKFFIAAYCPGFLSEFVLMLLNVLPGKKNVKNVNSDLISVIILKLFKHENHQLYIAPCTEFKVINVGSNTFGNPIFHEGLQN